MARNPAFDVTYYCAESDWLDFNSDIDASLELVSVSDANTLDFDIELYGTLVNGYAYNGTFEGIDISLSADFYIQYLKSNWLKWSKIGEFDFTQDKTNLAGEMPLDWAGDIYKIGKLGKNIIVYGSGGISTLVPVDNVFSKAILLPIGIMSKGSVVCTDSFHLFISTDGNLWKLSDKLESLGYDEYLSLLDEPIISYDLLTKLAYICDGSDGYIFNCDTYSMGKGPENITGIGYYNGSSYVMASGTVVNLDAYIETHLTDFGNRNFKTINEVEVGGEFGDDLEIGIMYRNNSSGNFEDPIWFSVTPEGRSFPNFFAKEFKFCFSTGDDIRLDYLRIKGMFADYNPIDA